VVVRARVDELHVDAQAVSDPLDGRFGQVAHPEIVGDHPHVGPVDGVFHHRRAADDTEARDPL
jgi:hypothetical protein